MLQGGRGAADLIRHHTFSPLPRLSPSFHIVLQMDWRGGTWCSTIKTAPYMPILLPPPWYDQMLSKKGQAPAVCQMTLWHCMTDACHMAFDPVFLSTTPPIVKRAQSNVISGGYPSLCLLKWQEPLSSMLPCRHCHWGGTDIDNAFPLNPQPPTRPQPKPLTLLAPFLSLPCSPWPNRHEKPPGGIGRSSCWGMRRGNKPPPLSPHLHTSTIIINTAVADNMTQTHLSPSSTLQPEMPLPPSLSRLCTLTPLLQPFTLPVPAIPAMMPSLQLALLIPKLMKPLILPPSPGFQLKRTRSYDKNVVSTANARDSIVVSATITPEAPTTLWWLSTYTYFSMTVCMYGARIIKWMLYKCYLFNIKKDVGHIYSF